MSIIENIAARLGYERRSTSWDLMRGVGMTTAAGAPVNANTVENLSTAVACTQAIASALASLPVWLYRSHEGGRDVQEAHPFMRLVRRGPNAWQTWPDFIEWLVAQVLLQGNGLAEIVTDRRGAVVELRPVPWNHVSVYMLPSGRLRYDVVAQAGMHGTTGEVRSLLDDQVLHVRDRSDDGVVGRSRLSRAGEVLSTALALQEASGAYWRNGVTPSGALRTDGQLGPEAKARLRESLQQIHAGPQNRAKVLILDAGLSWQQMSISPEDAELLGSRRFTVEELCRLFQVPPPIVQDYSHNTFTNAETAGRWFAQFTVAPWARKLETAMSRSLFGDPALDVEFDLSAFLRGDPATRWQSYAIAVQHDILTRDEVREVEGWNPRGETEVSAP